jgi:hypothetical protein
MGTVALSNRTQLFVSSHLLLAANACSASLSPQVSALLLEEIELIGDLAELVGDVPHWQFPYKLRLGGLPLDHPSSALLDQC